MENKSKSANRTINLLSERDIQIFKKTFRNMTENLYEDSTDEANVNNVIILERLARESIQTKAEADSLSLLSVMEMLKVRCKALPILIKETDKAIAHLKNPEASKLQSDTILECMKRQQLYSIGCTVAARFYQQISAQGYKFEWDSLIAEICKNSNQNTIASLELANFLCQNNQKYCKIAVKGGFVKYIFSVYLLKNKEDRYHLYKALKLLKLISDKEKTVIRDRENYLSEVIYIYDEYIPISANIATNCFDSEYCRGVQANTISTIDKTYVWSYVENFCKNILRSQTTRKLSGELQNQDLAKQREKKIYAILSNMTKFTGNLNEKALEKIPIFHESGSNYLKLIFNSLKHNSGVGKNIDMDQIRKLVDKSDDPKFQQMFKSLQEKIAASQTKKTVGQLSSSHVEIFILQNNVEQWMERAEKIHQEDEPIQAIIIQIFNHKSSSNEFENDSLYTIQQKALESLRKAITGKKKVDINRILQKINLSDIRLLCQLLQNLEIYLMINPETIENVHTDRVIQIIKWIEDNYAGEDIDWGSIGQLLGILKGSDTWLKNLSKAPDSCFWLLGVADQYSPEEEIKIESLFSKISSMSNQQKQVKLPLIIGFTGRMMSLKFKQKILQKYSNLLKIIENNIRERKAWKTNILMLSYFIKGWHEGKGAENQLLKQLVSQTHSYVTNNFCSTPQQYRFIERCLPHKIDPKQFEDNLEYLVSQFGQLASQVYRNGANKEFSYEKLSSITGVDQINSDLAESIYQILKFLCSNPEVLHSDQLLKLTNCMTQKDSRYWQFYPNYQNIAIKILSVVAEGKNSAVNKDASKIVAKLLQKVNESKQISQQQKQEIQIQIKNTIFKLKEKKVYIEIEIIKNVLTKIKETTTKQQTIILLNEYETQLEKQKETERAKISKAMQQQKKKPTQPEKVTTSKDEDLKLGNQEDRKQQLFTVKSKEDMDWEQSEDVPISSGMTVMQALRKLNMILQDKEKIDTFPLLAKIFQDNDMSEIEKDYLGILLVEFYDLQENPLVIDLLLQKNKSTLTNDHCYRIVSKHINAFVLSTRWKLAGRQWLDLATQRVNQGFVADGCQVAEYNILEHEDIEYFMSKKYHEIFIKLIYKVKALKETCYYLQLIGTSARLTEVRQKYASCKIHASILTFINQWPSQMRVIANLSYALSSLVYTKNEICIQIVKRKELMLTLFAGLKMFANSKMVVDSGCCLVANLAYANDQCKQIMRSYKIIQILIYILEANINNDDLSTHKQILRAFGNMSLLPKCSEQIIDSNFNSIAVKLTEKLDIFIHIDEDRLKFLKTFIDLIANVSSHHYKLEKMHKEGISLIMITLLQTATHPPIIMGCIDTIDSLCQNKQIQTYTVTAKKLPYILIDVLKIQEDEKIVVKATRMLTNLTINKENIPYILQANLLSVLGNIVMPIFYAKKAIKVKTEKESDKSASKAINDKFESYFYKILTRIHLAKPDQKLLLKSGYLDCLIRHIELSENLEDACIDILLFHAFNLLNFLNKRAFLCVIIILTRKHKNNQIFKKCIKIAKTLIAHAVSDQEEEDFLIEGCLIMYTYLFKQSEEDALNLLTFHVYQSDKFKEILVETQNKFSIINNLIQLSYHQRYAEVSKSTLTAIFKGRKPENIIQIESETNKQEIALSIMQKGFNCMLFRIDGSSKKAIIDMDKENNLRAYKQSSGQIKSKYVVNTRYIRNWEFQYVKESRQWSLSVFSKGKGLFNYTAEPSLCLTMSGSRKWNEVTFINICFLNAKDHEAFRRAFYTLILAQRG